jgi:hypothetical protein
MEKVPMFKRQDVEKVKTDIEVDEAGDVVAAGVNYCIGEKRKYAEEGKVIVENEGLGEINRGIVEGGKQKRRYVKNPNVSRWKEKVEQKPTGEDHGGEMVNGIGQKREREPTGEDRGGEMAGGVKQKRNYVKNHNVARWKKKLKNAASEENHGADLNDHAKKEAKKDEKAHVDNKMENHVLQEEMAVAKVLGAETILKTRYNFEQVFILGLVSFPTPSQITSLIKK